MTGYLIGEQNEPQLEWEQGDADCSRRCCITEMGWGRKNLIR